MISVAEIKHDLKTGCIISANIEKFAGMKYLLILILISATGFSIYKQHEEITALKTDLDSSRQQIEKLQKMLDAEKNGTDQSAVASQVPAQPGTPVGNPPAGTRKSGSWMWDPNHVSPMGTPVPNGKRRSGP